jgi:DNA polymerase-1
MEWEGTPVDEAEIRSSWKVLHEEVEYWLTQVRHYSGDPTFQIKDSQLRELFYVRLGMEAPKVTEDGKFSVDQESRHLLRAQYPAHEKLIDAVNHHARTKKIESTYAVNFLRHVTPEGKIHASYNQLERREQGSGIPVTGRLSSANPNMQNIAKKPIHLRHCGCKKCAEEYGRDYGVEQSVSVRRYFTVPPGMVRAFVDLSQIELRTLAWFSQDPVLLHCYANDMDVHQITADECTGGNRDIAKQVNFRNSYGMTEVGLAKRLPYYWENPKQAIADAGDYLRKFFQTYAGIIRFRDRLAAEMRANGNMFVSPFGRPRRIPTIASNDERERSRAERMMMSSIISGTAADLMKEIMLRSGAMLAAEHPEVRIVQSIHDEVVYDMPIEGCAEVLPKIMKCFTDWPMFEARGVPIRASCELSTTTWEEKRTLLLDPDGFRWA